MIDYIKMYVKNLKVAEKWLNSVYLKFNVEIGYNTGEISKNKIIANYRGLKFTIFHKDTTLTKIVRLQVTGSLHKYRNKGKHNYNDFDYSNLLEVIKELESKFYIHPYTTTIHNIEFGVNVFIMIEVNEMLKNLIAFKTYNFKTLSEDKQSIGKQLVNLNHRLKIYNKGKQSKLKTKELLRVEMHYNKMNELKKYNITTLADLTSLRNLKPLIKEITNRWSNIIYYDKSINLKHLTPTQQKRVLYSAIPRNWVEYTKKQRMRAKKRFKELMSKHGSTTQKDINDIIVNKWAELTAEKCPPFNHPEKEIQQQKSVPLLTVSIDGYKGDKTTLKKNNRIISKKRVIFLPIIPNKKKVCKNCNTDISHKRESAKYCSKKCSNKVTGKKRTLKRQKKILQEKESLKKIFKALNKSKLSLTISYKHDNKTYTDKLMQKEIKTTKIWIRNTQKIVVVGYCKNAPPIVLTSYRARKLLNTINKTNL